MRGIVSLDNTNGHSVQNEVDQYLNLVIPKVPLRDVIILPTKWLDYGNGEIELSKVLLIWDKPQPEYTRLQQIADDTGME